MEKTVSQDALSTVDEVFASIDEANTISSRTVSQDKISTITEVGHNRRLLQYILFHKLIVYACVRN